MPLLEKSPTQPAVHRTPVYRSQPSLPAPVPFLEAIRSSGLLKRAALWALAILAAFQFVGAYLYLEFPYVNLQVWETGSERLPFQTRLLLAPLYRVFEQSAMGQNYAARLARNSYFFPNGVTPGMVLEFFIDTVCVLIAGWVTVRIYEAASRRRLFGPLVYPLFLAMCVLLYVLHTVQNFRYMYDLPSLAFFSVGFYLIYFRKPVTLFALLFAVATLNRETTLLLLPFWAISQVLGPNGRVRWRGLLERRVVTVLGLLGLYWLLWHHVVFAMFGANPSEYYPRVMFNLHCFLRLRYWPQLACAFAFTWPLLLAYGRQVRDAQLRAWMLVLPLWYGFMLMWAVLTETRVFGELIPFLAPAVAIIAEELFAARLLRTAFTGDQQISVRLRNVG